MGHTDRSPHAIEVDNREELIFLLSEASELEHMLCCSYLFAAFSLKTEPDEGLSPPEQQTVLAWQRSILDIAIQEMGHLALASNVLTAIGGAAHFRRPNFPQLGKYYPAHVHLTLEPLTARTLERFILMERPQDLARETDEHPATFARAEQTATDHEVVPEPQPYATVGDLYGGIESGLRQLVDRYGEARVFVGPPGAQASTALFQLAGITPVTDLASAVAAIGYIVEEGEGSHGERADAHYGRFVKIQQELARCKEANPAFAPARQVLANPCTQLPSDAPEAALVDDQTAAAVMDLFSAGYGLMVQMLARSFAPADESDEERAALVGSAIGAMAQVLGPLGRLITRLPAGPSWPGQTAGPGFEFHRALHTLPHRRAAWVLFQERWQELADYSRCLQETADAPAGLAEIEAAMREEAKVSDRYANVRAL
jgi:hypothetical protein